MEGGEGAELVDLKVVKPPLRSSINENTLRCVCLSSFTVYAAAFIIIHAVDLHKLKIKSTMYGVWALSLLLWLRSAYGAWVENTQAGHQPEVSRVIQRWFSLSVLPDWKFISRLLMVLQMGAAAVVCALHFVTLLSTDLWFKCLDGVMVMVVFEILLAVGLGSCALPFLRRWCPRTVGLRPGEDPTEEEPKLTDPEDLWRDAVDTLEDWPRWGEVAVIKFVEASPDGANVLGIADAVTDKAVDEEIGKMNKAVDLRNTLSQSAWVVLYTCLMLVGPLEFFSNQSSYYASGSKNVGWLDASTDPLNQSVSVLLYYTLSISFRGLEALIIAFSAAYGIHLAVGAYRWQLTVDQSVANVSQLIATAPLKSLMHLAADLGRADCLAPLLEAGGDPLLFDSKATTVSNACQLHRNCAEMIQSHEAHFIRYIPEVNDGVFVQVSGRHADAPWYEGVIVNRVSESLVDVRITETYYHHNKHRGEGQGLGAVSGVNGSGRSGSPAQSSEGSEVHADYELLRGDLGFDQRENQRGGDGNDDGGGGGDEDDDEDKVGSVASSTVVSMNQVIKLPFTQILSPIQFTKRKRSKPMSIKYVATSFRNVVLQLTHILGEVSTVTTGDEESAARRPRVAMDELRAACPGRGALFNRLCSLSQCYVPTMLVVSYRSLLRAGTINPKGGASYVPIDEVRWAPDAVVVYFSHACLTRYDSARKRDPSNIRGSGGRRDSGTGRDSGGRDSSHRASSEDCTPTVQVFQFKARALLEAMRHIAQERGIPPTRIFAWVDAYSLDRRSQQPYPRATSVLALPIYMSMCDEFVVLGPEAKAGTSVSDRANSDPKHPLSLSPSGVGAGAGGGGGTGAGASAVNRCLFLDPADLMWNRLEMNIQWHVDRMKGFRSAWQWTRVTYAPPSLDIHVRPMAVSRDAEPHGPVVEGTAENDVERMLCELAACLLAPQQLLSVLGGSERRSGSLGRSGARLGSRPGLLASAAATTTGGRGGYAGVGDKQAAVDADDAWFNARTEKMGSLV